MALPKLYNPALAGGGDPATQQFGEGRGRELDKKIVNLLSGKDEGASLIAAASQAPTSSQQGGGMFGQPRSMDWRARAAELMRRQMIDRSNEQERPAWMMQRG